jgi:hypothetical protein
MREMSVSEQRYQAELAVIGDGHTVTEVAGRWSGADGRCRSDSSWAPGRVRGRRAGRSRRCLASPSVVSTPDAGRYRGPGSRDAAAASVVGFAADPSRAGQEDRTGAFGVRGVSGAGQGHADQPRRPWSPRPALETVGRRSADGAWRMHLVWGFVIGALRTCLPVGKR